MEQSVKTYGRVINGQIVEYPVYEEHIVNRGHPFNWYTPCIYEGAPALPPYAYAKENIRIVGDRIVVSYTAEPMGLSQLLTLVWGEDPSRIRMPHDPALTEPDLAQLDPLLMKAIENAVKVLVQARLDTFAQQRGYDGILSACSYVTSTKPGYATDAQRAVQLRDETWDAATNLLNAVVSGQSPMIKSYADIEAVLPLLSW